MQTIRIGIRYISRPTDMQMSHSHGARGVYVTYLLTNTSSKRQYYTQQFVTANLHYFVSPRICMGWLDSYAILLLMPRLRYAILQR